MCPNRFLNFYYRPVIKAAKFLGLSLMLVKEFKSKSYTKVKEKNEALMESVQLIDIKKILEKLTFLFTPYPDRPYVNFFYR